MIQFIKLTVLPENETSFIVACGCFYANTSAYMVLILTNMPCGEKALLHT